MLPYRPVLLAASMNHPYAQAYRHSKASKNADRDGATKRREGDVGYHIAKNACRLAYEVLQQSNSRLVIQLHITTQESEDQGTRGNVL